LPTSQELEALGVELMEKAAELDRETSLLPPVSNSRKMSSRRE
jgi:hypothetical protein